MQISRFPFKHVRTKSTRGFSNIFNFSCFACDAAVSFSFPGGEIKQAASELGAEQKLGRKWEHSYRLSEKGEVVEGKGAACLTPPPYFSHQLAVLFPSRAFFWKGRFHIHKSLFTIVKEIRHLKTI